MKNFILSALFGFTALLLVDLTSAYTGIFLTVSKLSIALSGLLGVPGVVLMIILNFLL